MCKFFSAALLILIVFVGCNRDNVKTNQEWMKSNDKIKVLSTIAMIDELVKKIGNDFVDTSVLIKGELDPHSYQIVKGDDEKLAFADVIFFSGLGLEHGASLQSYLLKNAKSVGLGDKLIGENPNLLLYFRGQPDPHIWMDISLWTRIVPYIVETLSHKDPVHAQNYKENGENLIRSMLEVHHQIKNELQNISPQKRYLVTSHDAFNYFTRAYLAEENEDEIVWSERFAAPEGLAPESQISTTDIQMIINHLKKYKIHVLFPESNVNRDSIKKIIESASQKGLEVKMAKIPLYADAMGKAGSDGDTYFKMMQHNAKTIGIYLRENGG